MREVASVRTCIIGRAGGTHCLPRICQIYVFMALVFDIILHQVCFKL